MLINVNLYQHFTDYRKDRNIEDFDEPLGWERRSKRMEEEKLIYQQACEEGALRGAASLLLTLCPNIASAPSDRQTAATTETSPNHRERLINYWKCPTNERNAGDF